MLRTNQRNKGAFTASNVAKNFEDIDRNHMRLWNRIMLLESRLSNLSGISGAFSLGNLNLRRGTVTVSAGSNTITFDRPMNSTDYTLVCKIKDSGSADIQYNETSKSQGSATITCSDAGTLTYVAIEIF